ncbi:lysine--tRNA ligase [Candidatus Woesebacteria bacterium]|nr:lysine--tRNA ligase [Candidatus Woesebacteria bacterium]
MYWADKIAKSITDSGKFKPYWVDDMKTPSGRIHVGSLRGVVTHNLIYQALLDLDQKATFSYVFDDHDPMDGLPVYLDKERWEKYLGQPLFSIPSPAGKSKSYAEYFAEEFREVFNQIGCKPKIIWGSELYLKGLMNAGVKKCLDKAQIVRRIYTELYHKKMPDDWYPFHVVCPKCGKISTTKVTDWDGEEVTFECKVSGLDYTQGCGLKGKISPYSGKGKFVGKLPWKVEWAVKWQVIGVTIEGAGKDHMTAGGSHEVAEQVAEKVLDYPVPYAFSHEFFLIGQRKMSSSKGLGVSAQEISEILPPSVLRFLFIRTDYRQAIDFDPMGTMFIPDLFDEYDRSWQAYIEGKREDLARVFVLSQITEVPAKKSVFLPRFREVAYLFQGGSESLIAYFAEKKGSSLTAEEEKILEERIKYAKIWLGSFAPVDFKFEIKGGGKTDLSAEFIKKLIGLVNGAKSPEDLEKKIYGLIKDSKIPPKKAFPEIYQVLTGKTHGPKLAWLIWENKEKSLEIFRKLAQ